MKAKIYIGDMGIEIEGSPHDMAEMIGLRNTQVVSKDQTIQFSPAARSQSPLSTIAGAEGKITTTIEPQGSLSQKKVANKSQKRAGRKKGSKALVPWSAEDTEKLIKGYNENMSIPQLAKHCNRTERAITQRIIKLRNSGELL